MITSAPLTPLLKLDNNIAHSYGHGTGRSYIKNFKEGTDKYMVQHLRDFQFGVGVPMVQKHADIQIIRANRDDISFTMMLGDFQNAF